MTVTPSTLLSLPIIGTGTESGQWGNITNNGLTEYLDIAIAGMSSLTSANFTAGALTINQTAGTSSATNITSTSAQYAGFRVSSLAVNSTITVDNTGGAIGRSYRIINADSTYTLTFKATGQTGITFQPGQTGVVAYNGTDYVLVTAVGAASSTDNAVARFDSTSGKILQNSGVTIDDSNNLTLPGQADLRFADSDSSNWVAFQGASTIASNVTWTLPATDGSSGQVMQTNGSGTLSWTTAGGISTGKSIAMAMIFGF